MVADQTKEDLKRRVAELEQQVSRLKSEAIKYQTLFNSFPHGITITDASGHIIETNQIAQKILGIEKNEHEERDIDSSGWRIVRPDGSDMPSDEWASVIALNEKRTVTNCEMGIVKGGGETTWLSVTAAPLPLDNYGVVVTYKDISSRMAAQQKFKESEEKYRGIFDESIASIYVFDAQKKFVDANQAGLDLLGIELEDLLGMSIHEVDADPGIVLSAHQRLLEGRRLINYEHQLKRKDGTIITVLNNSRPLTDAAGNVSGMLSTLIDITERKRVEEALSWEANVKNALSELTQTLIKASSIEDISAQVLETSKEFTTSVLGYVGYIETATNHLICPTMTHDIWESCQINEKKYVFKTYHGLWGWVLKNRKALLTNSAMQDSRSAGIPKGHMPIHRFLSVPATYRNGVVGQISLANPAREYTDRDLFLLERIADVYAIAIHKKRSEDALQEAHDNLEKQVEERTADLKKSNEQLKQEITERRRIERILKAERQRLYSVLNELPAFICLRAHDYSIGFANRHFQERFGQYEENKCYESLRERDEPCSICPADTVLETGEYQEWESAKLKDGRIYHIYAYPFNDVDGSQLILELGIDITKIKLAETEIRRLSTLLINAQEDERRRVAFELHDGLGQNLSLIKLHVGSIKRKLGKDQKALMDICKTMSIELNHTIDEVRRISSALSPSILVDMGLCSAIRWLIERFVDNFNPKVLTTLPDKISVFSQNQEITIYRIFQEILTNIGKHANAGRVSASCEMEPEMALFTVEDDGAGFDVEKFQTRPASEKGLGLMAMEERIKMLAGQLQILSQKGKGTRIAFSIPIDQPTQVD